MYDDLFGPPAALPPGAAQVAALRGQPLQPPVDPLIERMLLLQKQEQEALQQQADAYKPVDRAPMEQAYRAQQDMGGRHLLNALAAQEAGKDFAPMQAHFLKQAATAQAPMKMQGGTMTEAGFVEDPGFEQDQNVKRAQARITQIEKALTTNASDQSRVALAKERDQLQRDLQARDERLRRDIAEQASRDRRYAVDNRRGSGDGDGDGNTKATYEGVTPDGERIVADKQGALFKVTQGPNGKAMQTPYFGSVIPKASHEKAIATSSGLLGQADAAAALIKKLETAKGEDFGWRAGVQALTPGFAKDVVRGKLGITQEGADLAALMRTDAAQQISDMYGAAQSVGEANRAKGFIPSADDDLPTLVIKMRAAEAWARDKARRSGTAARGAAEERTGIPQQSEPYVPPPPPPPVVERHPKGWLSAAEAEKLDRGAEFIGLDGKRRVRK